jgi:hypothetical protein
VSLLTCGKRGRKVVSVVEARITVGRFSLVVGGPHGTEAAPAEQPEAQAENALAAALDAPAPPPSPAAAVASSIEEVDKTTSAVEQATGLAEALAKGMTLDPQTIQTQLNGLIDLAEKADREGRFEDEIRLSRALVTLLSLTGRWLALIETLRRVGNAAAAVGDPSSAAWAQHELGTFSLAGGDRAGATEHLEEARRLRESQGDLAGADASARNLALARTGGRPGFGHRALVIGAIVVGGLVLLAGGLALGGVFSGGDGSTDTEATSTDEPTTTVKGNGPPTAGDVTVRTPEDEAVDWTPKVNDPDDDTLTCEISVVPKSGEATVEDDCSSGTYTPPPDVSGPVSFAYSVSDGKASPVRAVVNVVVEPVNDPPTASDVDITTDEDTAADWTPTVMDVDDERLTCTISQTPTNGTATLDPDCKSGTYTPSADYNGPDAFTYTVTDASGASTTANATVTVNPVPDVD